MCVVFVKNWQSLGSLESIYYDFIKEPQRQKQKRFQKLTNDASWTSDNICFEPTVIVWLRITYISKDPNVSFLNWRTDLGSSGFITKLSPTPLGDEVQKHHAAMFHYIHPHCTVKIQHQLLGHENDTLPLLLPVTPSGADSLIINYTVQYVITKR